MPADTEILTIAESVELVRWVERMSEEECRGLLCHLCGYRPSLMARMKEEREDES